MRHLPTVTFYCFYTVGQNWLASKLRVDLLVQSLLFIFSTLARTRLSANGLQVDSSSRLWGEDLNFANLMLAYVTL